MKSIHDLKAELRDVELRSPFAPLARYVAARQIEGRVSKIVEHNWKGEQWITPTDKDQLLKKSWKSYVPIRLTYYFGSASFAIALGLGSWAALSYFNKLPIPKMPAILWKMKWPIVGGFLKTGVSCFLLNIDAGTERAIDQLRSEFNDQAIRLSDVKQEAEKLSYSQTWQNEKGVIARIRQSMADLIVEQNRALKSEDFKILLPNTKAPSNLLMYGSLFAVGTTALVWLGVNGYGIYRLANKAPLPLWKTLGIEAAVTGAAALALQQHFRATSATLIAALRNNRVSDN